MDEEDLLRRLLARRMLLQFLGGASLPEPQVTAGVRTAGGASPQGGRPAPRRAKRGANTEKTLAQDRAAQHGVGIERGPVETVLPDAPVTPGSGVSRIERTTRPLSPAELLVANRRR